MKKGTLTAWPSLAGCFIAGVATTFVLFAAGHQVIYPKLCAVDGTLWATWAQAIAIAGTGTAALIIANRQLGVHNAALLASNKVEKMRNTISVADDVYKRLTIYDQEMSPMTATAVLGITAHVPENLERFEEGFAEMKAGASPGSQPAYEHVSVAMAVANNYFGGLWFLIENDLIERDFILNRFANLSLTAHSDQVALGARQPRPDFDKMARASYEYLKDRGLDAQPPVVATVLQSGSE